MIDIEKEAAKLVQGWVLNDMNDPHAREALEGRIAALCRRVAEAEREDVVSRVEVQFVKEHDNSAVAIGINIGVQRAIDAIRKEAGRGVA